MRPPSPRWDSTNRHRPWGPPLRAVDHAVESVLADNAHPYSDALALDALKVLIGFPSNLLESHHFEDDEMGGVDAEQELRQRCMVAAWMAHSGSLHIDWGLSHRM